MASRRPNITLTDVVVGLASLFRTTINANNRKIEEAINSLPDVVVSREQPTGQKAGDFWLQIVDDDQPQQK